jgi:hypothetical protein
LWSGLFSISAVLKRHVYFPKRILGSYNIFPNLYVIFVGPPAVIRKSTTTGYAEDLLSDLVLALNGKDFPLISVAATTMSDSKFVETLSQTPDGSITILSSEFGNFMKTSKEAMYDLLTDLFDGNSRVSRRLQVSSVTIAKRPRTQWKIGTSHFPQMTWTSESVVTIIVSMSMSTRLL